eukprot:4731674-Amphidinium_carterae.1
MAEITISLGHGLRGMLPSISGTVGLLSLWENGLEGHLPLTKGTEWWRQWQPGIVNSQCRDCFPSSAPLSSMR